MKCTIIIKATIKISVLSLEKKNLMAVLFVCKVNNILNIGKMKNVRKKTDAEKTLTNIIEKLNSMNSF